MDSMARVRIFAAGEFAVPVGWPEDVGVAAILADGIEVFPAHTRESATDVLRRIATLTERDLRGAPVHPTVAGHPVCDLSFSAVAELRSSVEDFLSRFPEAVDEADDFAVNFGYAVEEGIALPDLLAPVTVSAGAEPGAMPRSDAEVLPGYVSLTGLTATPPRFPRAVLRVSFDGRMMVLLDPDQPVVTAATPSVLLREDGLGLAVPVDALPLRHGALSLPSGCLPWIPEGVEGEIPLLAVERGGFLLVSFLPEWAWALPQESSAPVLHPDADGQPAADPDAPSPRGWAGLLWPVADARPRRRVAGLAFLCALVIGTGFGLVEWHAAEGDAAAQPAAVDALRAGLFG